MFDVQAVDVVAAVALLAEKHFALLLLPLALDAALAFGALPIVVPHARTHPMRHFNTTGMHCNVPEK